jgi:TP901 family phage tail tape measure protein
LADRVVKVTIQASIDNYVKGMERVRKATADTAKESEKLEKVGHAATSVGTALGVVGAAATGAAAVVIKMAADFDAQMSKVQAATNATSADMSKFREQALTAGAAFGYTATQVTEAQVELGKAGLATKDILGGGLDGVLALAASDNVELGKATQIAAVAMKQFGLSGKDVPHIADELAAGAGKALGGVEQLGDALNQSGLVASNFGLSLEETTGLLSSFADEGLLGSDAGTSLKTMLQALANPSKQSAEQMKALGINVKDANGNFLGAADLAQLLHDKLGDLSNAQRQQALSQIFGSDAVRAATVLYKEGADGIQGYIDQNNDAGYAMQQAAIKSDNLNGDLKKLKSAFQSGLIETGGAADGALRPLVQTMTQVVQTFNGLPEPLKGAALGMTGVVGAAGLLGGGLMVAIPKIVEFRAALMTLKEGGFTGRAGLASLTGFLTGPWGLALGVAAAAATIFIGKQVEAAQQTEALQGTLDKTTGALTKQSREYIAAALQSESFLGKVFGQGSTLDQADKLGLSIDTVTRAATGSAKAYRELKREQDRLNDAAEGGNSRDVDRANSMGRVLDKVNELRGSTTAAQEKQKQLNEALDSSGSSSDAAASGLDSITDSAEDATQAISDTANAIKGFNSSQLDVNSAQRDFEAAIDAVTDSVKENGDSLDVTTDKGRQNAATLDSIAQSTLNYAGALYQQTGSQDQATSALNSGRDSLIAALGQYGVTGQAAQDYANKILGTPTDWATLFQADTADAAGKTDDLHNKVDAVPSKKIVKAQGDVADALDKLEATKAKLASVPASKRTKVEAQVADAQANLLSVLHTLNQLQSKTLTVTTVNRKVDQAVAAGAAPGAAKAAYKAGGGHVRGPGSETSDSIPAYLSDNEYVIKASSVRKYGTPFLDKVNAGRFANGGHVQRFANGGGVQYQYDKFAGNYTGLQGVSQLISMYNDSNLSNSLRNQSGLAALSFQRSLTNLSDKSDAAARKLGDLRSSADSLKSSVASAVAKFDVGNYRSAGGLSSGLARTAGKAKEFAGLLVKLQQRGVAPALLSEIAELGSVEGLPLARSLASASSAQIKSIDGSYSSIQWSAGKAGQTVADASYKTQIAAADKNARSLEAQIAKQSVAIQRIIARGFGVKGYASGGYTGEYGTAQVAGLVHGREFVVNAAATARNRALLEAVNSGQNVRYMDPTPRAATAAAVPIVNNRQIHNYLSVQDPTAVAQAIERRERAAYA